jgi:NodT family efflux transporter outer membrane factor (OMF) lipoprotein
VTQDRWKAGFTTELDVAQAQTQLETTRSQLPLLETMVRQASFQLAVLLGEQPETFNEDFSDGVDILASGRPGGPPPIPIGLPAELLRRRPDIRRAERQLAATTARIGVATADLFPRFSLTGTFGTATTEFRHFLDQRSFTWGIGPSIQWPIFEGGRIHANIRAEQAREEQALATYGQTVLTSLQEVESSLVAYDQERRRLETLIAAVRSGQRATQLSNDLYTRGLGPFLNVLDAQRALYVTQDAMVLSETAVLTDLIALYKALGGGWESTNLTTQPVESETASSN